MSEVAQCLKITPYLPLFTREQLHQALDIYCSEHGLKTPHSAPKTSSHNPFLGLRFLNLCIELMARIPTGVLELAEELGLANPENYKSVLSIYTQQHAPLRALQNFAQPPLWLRHAFHTQHAQQKIDISHISPSRYRHSGDIEVTQMLDQAMPFEGLARAMSKHLSEKALQLKNDGGAIRVSESQLPDLHAQFKLLAKRLGVHPVPPLYVSYGSLNAYTSGIEKPVVVVHEACISQLSSSELSFVLGHELGHIQFEHMLYHTISRMGMAQAMILAPNVLLSRLGGASTDLKIKEWSRLAELSCDRAGLLAAQDPEAALRVMLRFAGAPAKYLDTVNIDTYLEQYEAHQENTKSRVTDFLMGADRSHPWIIERIHQLREWIDNGDYDAVLADGHPEQDATTAQNPLTPYLHYIGLPTRYWQHLNRSHTPILWVLGDRTIERKRALDLLNSPEWKSAEPTDAIVLEGDRVLFTLNAHALLSEQERRHIQACHDAGAEVALLVYNLDGLEASDLLEITERLDLFRSEAGWAVFKPETSSPLETWKNSPVDAPEANISPLEQLELWIQQHRPEEHAFKARLEKALHAADHTLATEFEALSNEFESWFEPMTPEERRYEGSARLQDACQNIIKNAARVFESAVQLQINAPKTLNLAARHPEIPSTLIASGVGALAFGFVLFPGAPIWLMLSGLGVGVGSVISGRSILNRQRDDLSKQQLVQAKTYLDSARVAASTSFQELHNQLLNGHKTTEVKGWSSELAQD